MIHDLDKIIEEGTSSRAAHTVHLIRSPNGDMVVTIDDIEVMRTSDFSFRDDFAGVVIVNNGGSYSYDNIEFFIEQ